MAETKSGGPPKPSNKRKTTSKKATKPPNNNKSATKPDVETHYCKWGECLAGGCRDLKYSADLMCCEFSFACNNMMHVDCYLAALYISTNAPTLKDLGITDESNFEWMRCPEHCDHYKKYRERKKKKSPPENNGRTRLPEKRSLEEDEMGMKQPETYAQASAYHSGTDSSSEEDDRKQPAKKRGEIDHLLSDDDTTSDENDGGGKQPSRKLDTWNCCDGDLMPYEGGRCNSEEGSCSSIDSSSDDTSDDDDDDDGNNSGQGASTTKKKAARVGNETAAAERMVATATTETAAAAGATSSTSVSTIEDAAIAFAQRGFTLDGTELKKEDKQNIVGVVVCRLLRDHPDPDGENQMDPSEISQMFDGWVNPAWWHIAFDTWQVLYEMLDKKKEKIKGGTNVGGVFSEHACKLGRIFHTEQCVDATCDLCDRSLPPRVPSQEMPLAKRKLVQELVDCYVKAARDARRTQSTVTAKNAQQQKKAKKYLKGKHVPNFKYSLTHVAEERCPSCGHRYFQKLKTDKDMTNANKERKKEYRAKLKKFNKKPVSQQKAANKPRLRSEVMTFKCPCLWLKGSKCPLCKGSDMDKCEICNCTCQVGPCERKDFEAISRAAQSRARGLEENTAPRTVSENVQSFVSLLTNSLQNGQRDLRANNIEETPNNIAGAGAAYLSRAQITDDQRHFISQQMGEPTSDLGDDVHISELQRAGADNRYYNNRLHRISMGGAASAAPAETAPAAAAPPPPPREGVSETPPPPTSQQNLRSTRSSASTFSDRMERSINRVFKQIVHNGTDLQVEGTPATKKRRSKRVRRALSDKGNNVIKMRVSCEVVNETPEPGFSQRMAYDIVNSSDVNSSDDDDEQYKKK